MIPELGDTIVALSSASGPGARAIVRLSGPAALRCAATLFRHAERAERGAQSAEHAEDDSAALCAPRSALAISPARRRCYSGHLRLTGVHSLLPADLYYWPAPRTYTGQELVELHTLSSRPLVDLLISQLMDAGARAAQPGEFTLRAFVAGKLDLTRAEAVLGIIEAGNRQELKQALAQLAGGVARPLQVLRDDLLNLLADVEAGLDFADEDIHFIERSDLLHRLTRGLAQLELLRKQLEQRAVGERPFRVVLVGRPNAGKSSLFNALAGSPSALVSAQPGTTRDYLVQRLECDGVRLELMDTAGWQSLTSPTPTPTPNLTPSPTPTPTPNPSLSPWHDQEAGEGERVGVGVGVRVSASEGAAGTIEEQAQVLGREQAEQADLLLLCLEAGKPEDAQETRFLTRNEAPAVVGVATKCDLAPPRPDRLATSAATGAGVDRLRAFLAERARAYAQPALAPSLSRCRHHVEACLDHLRQAHEAVLFEEPTEVLALQLRGALDELGELVGAVYTDDLLDRIFSRFCIGK